jgi:hypothetical protein
MVIPEKIAQKLDWQTEQILTWSPGDPASSYPFGIILDEDGGILDGATFRGLRDSFGARIETDDPELVCAALGLPVDEPGILKSEKS